MTGPDLQARLRDDEIVVLDGGVGTELERRGAAMDPAAWCGPATLDNVELLEGVHRDYIAAGAEVITANTYASSRLMLGPAGFGDRVEEINRSAVGAALRARKAAGRPDVSVAGSLSQMSPLQSGSDRVDRSREPSDRALREAFTELAGILRESGCDLILLEMMYDPRRIELALEAALGSGLPVWIGFSARREDDGRVVGFARDRAVPLEDLLVPLRGADVQAAGLMHTASNVIGDALAIVREHYDGPLLAYPDSGYFRMPHWQFENVIEPEVLVDFARGWVDRGVRIVGGCCGLSPEHIRALATAFGRG